MVFNFSYDILDCLSTFSLNKYDQKTVENDPATSECVFKNPDTNITGFVFKSF